jgi:hypothetical protein
MTSPISDQIIPAVAGYSLLRFTYRDRKVTVDFAKSEIKTFPIVGFRTIDCVVLPVAIGDVETPPDSVDAIHCPNGIIYTIDGRAFKGIDAYCGELTKTWAAWREKLPKAPPPPPRPLVPGQVIAGRRPSGFLEDPNAPRIA